MTVIVLFAVFLVQFVLIRCPDWNENNNSIVLLKDSDESLENISAITEIPTCLQSEQEVNGTVIVWPETQFGTATASTPLCIDKNMRIIKRQCVAKDDGYEFSDVPNCHHFQQPITNLCSDGLQMLDGQYCYTIIAETTFPPQCPYPETLEWDKYVNFHLTDKPMWMPFQRQNNPYYGVDLMRNTETSKNYKVPFSLCTDTCKTFFFQGNLLENNCLVYHNATHVEAVPCDSKYSTVCLYEALNQRKTTLCSQSQYGCFQSDYNTSSKCFCIDESDADPSTPTLNLVEFKQPFQNLLFNNIDKPCRIALENSEASIVWTQSKDLVQYTNWKTTSDVDFDFRYGVVTSSGWSLIEETKTQPPCLVYQIDPPKKETKLTLDYHDGFKLTVQNANMFKFDSSNFPLISCFTDADSKSLIYQIPALTVGTASEDQVVFTFPPLEIYQSGPGHYWCEGFQYPSLKGVSSNRFLLGNNSYKAEYVAILKLENYPEKLSLNPLTPENVEMLHTMFINGIPRNSSFYPRIFKIDQLDIQDKSMTVIFHLSSTDSVTGWEEFKALESIARFQKQFVFVDFRSVSYCPGGVTRTLGQDILWPLRNAGNSTDPEGGYCVTNSGKIVQRKCVDDFISGAHWDHLEDCVFYASSTVSKLLMHMVKMEDVLKLTTQYNDFLTIDVLLIASYIENNAEKNPDLKQLIGIASNVMNMQRPILYSAQQNFQAADTILKAIENVLKTSEFGDYKSDNIVVKSVNVAEENFYGLFLNNCTADLTFCQIQAISGKPIIRNQLFDNAYAAVYLSEALQEQILSYAKQNTTYVPKMVICVYFGSSLFIEQDAKTSNFVFEVVLPDFPEEFQGPLVIYYSSNTELTSLDYNCSYWKFNNTSSFWQAENTTKEDAAIFCHYYHLSFFTINVNHAVKVEESCPANQNYTLGWGFEEADGIPARLTRLVDSAKGNITNRILGSIDSLLVRLRPDVLINHPQFTVLARSSSFHMVGIGKKHEIFILDGNEEELNPSKFKATVSLSKELRRRIDEERSRIVVVFFHDALHFSNLKSTVASEMVIEVLFPDLYNDIEGEVLIQFAGRRKRSTCASSNFKSGGVWNPELPPRVLHNTSTCSFNHVTHFALVVTKDNITSKLEDIINSNLTKFEKMKEVEGIVASSSESLSAVDVSLVARIVLDSVEEGSFTEIASSIVSYLFNVPRGVLRQSQKLYNATDAVLFGVDEIAKKSNDIFVSLRNFSLIVQDFRNQSGLAVSNCAADFCSVEVLDIIDLESIEASTEALVVLSDGLKKQLGESNNTLAIITLYYNDALFNEDIGELETSKIFGVLFPGLQQALQGDLWVAYRTKDSSKSICAYWDYKPNLPGRWHQDPQSTRQGGLTLCPFSHTTHFALLLSNSDDYQEERVLDIVTDIECFLSLFGIIAILFTAMVFKKWRRNTGNVILINFSIAVSLKIVMLYVSEYVKDESEGELICVITGAILHYAILSECAWMLSIAILQFKRFVEVLGGPPKYVLIKALICGWVFPLFPVVCVLGIDSTSYEQGKSGLCYPSNLGLYLGVWLPVLLIVTINSIIFVFILYNVFHKKTECIDVTANHELLFQWRLALLLFFMLGLTWLFGFLGQIKNDTFFTYLFCVTASLQGFVMFLFFIVFNKNTRMLYLQGIKQRTYSKRIFKVGGKGKGNFAQ